MLVRSPLSHVALLCYWYAIEFIDLSVLCNEISSIFFVTLPFVLIYVSSLSVVIILWLIYFILGGLYCCMPHTEVDSTPCLVLWWSCCVIFSPVALIFALIYGIIGIFPHPNWCYLCFCSELFCGDCSN